MKKLGLWWGGVIERYPYIPDLIGSIIFKITAG
jgi:hypothetical protein